MFYLCVNMYLLLLFRLTVQDKRIDSVATHSSLPPPMLFMCLQDISWLQPLEYMNKNDFDGKCFISIIPLYTIAWNKLENNFIIKMSDLIWIFIIYIEWEISTEEIWVCIVCWLYISVQTTVYLYNALFDDIIMYYKYTIMFKDNQTCWVKVNNLWNEWQRIRCTPIRHPDW